MINKMRNLHLDYMKQELKMAPETLGPLIKWHFDNFHTFWFMQWPSSLDASFLYDLVRIGYNTIFKILISLNVQKMSTPPRGGKAYHFPDLKTLKPLLCMSNPQTAIRILLD